MTDSLLDTAALDDASVWEMEDEDPTFDPDYAWLDEPEMSFAQEFDSQMDSIGWGDDSWVSDCMADCDGNWG